MDGLDWTLIGTRLAMKWIVTLPNAAGQNLEAQA